MAQSDHIKQCQLYLNKVQEYVNVKKEKNVL